MVINIDIIASVLRWIGLFVVFVFISTMFNYTLIYCGMSEVGAAWWEGAVFASMCALVPINKLTMPADERN